ncbi:MAG: hypothetical protein EBS90_07905 [Betaproteobacteria bacterium]|nr:hypothetical protein [Betaproteobacteria bacterium]
MAETWYDYFAAPSSDSMARQAALAKEKYSALRGLLDDAPDAAVAERYVSGPAHLSADARTMRDLHQNRWPPIDPRGSRMQLLGDHLVTPVFTDYGEGEGGTINNSLGNALDAGGRMRDTAIRSVQELAEGNLSGAADFAKRIIPSSYDPSQVAGGYGQPDDWRQYAGPIQGMVLDLATDPLNYVGAGVLRGGASRAARAAGSMADAARYGRTGIPVHLIDEGGNIIRRLRNAEALPAPRAPRPLALEYAR